MNISDLHVKGYSNIYQEVSNHTSRCTLQLSVYLVKTINDIDKLLIFDDYLKDPQ